MKAPRPIVGIGIVVLLIVAAMVAPQLRVSRESDHANSPSAVRRLAAVGYAKARLWKHFLRSREATFEGHEAPAPTLAEYRQFLRTVGLWELGDEISLMVFPAFERGPQVDRVEVVLARDVEPVELSVALWEKEDRPTPVGLLTIKQSNGDELQCESGQTSRPILWSYWPMTPKPILP